MLQKAWLLREAAKPPANELTCSVCLAARRAVPTPMIGAVVALGLAADEGLGDEREPRLPQQVVSRLLALSEEEVTELIEAVPPEVVQTDVWGESCPLAGRCGFWNLGAAYVREACRLGPVAKKG